ncbi:hypothetical protein KGF56_000698 [Candida oxycetoniae]|uniref:Nitronate monooxygenase domain-containing protein n=1 Tax=Candida oxycetoniae TaxID=497107 RepID=A0AAI9WZM3_9ASCO|nr:uncharacterized protein KGF56_000698 [Candida oxycetoniae]KAI3406566.2 hypothetical protein KGF56_000698 [Candida oxycetoniae]
MIAQRSSSKCLLEKLDISYPIFQSPMAGVSTPEMASAVTNSGGLGAIPLAPINFLHPNSIDKLKSLIDSYTLGLANKNNSNTINLNFFCHKVEPEPISSEIANWKTLYQNALNLPESILGKTKFTNGNISFRETEQDEQSLGKLFDFLEQYKPKLTSFHFGVPSHATIAKLHELDAMVFVTATSIDEVRVLCEGGEGGEGGGGVDGIILQGYEAGGHRGNFLTKSIWDENLSTQSLFQKTKQYVEKLEQDKRPFLVPAGGIMNTSQINWYIKNGASACQLGTVFLASPESTTSSFFSKLTQATPVLNNTIMIDVVSGKPARCIRTEFIDNLYKEYQSGPKSLPPYGYMYSAYKQLKTIAETAEPDTTLRFALNKDIGFYLAGQNFYQLEKGSTREIMKKLTTNLEQDLQP